jgi:acetyltransferase-like isoleucine patch superfamily enzyme
MTRHSATPRAPEISTRRVAATFARRPVTPDPDYEVEFAAHLRQTLAPAERLALYDRFRTGHTVFDAQMRRIVLRTLLGHLGNDVAVAADVTFLHPDRFEIDDGVFLGTGVFLQGRHDGHCRIGRRCWIGPSAYFDARDLVLGDFVGWGPGAKVLGSEHTGDPVEAAIIETDLTIAPVRVGDGADIGTGAIILPGVTIGEGAIVGAGAVVTSDVPAYTIVAGVPAKPLRSRRRMR